MSRPLYTIELLRQDDFRIARARPHAGPPVYIKEVIQHLCVPRSPSRYFDDGEWVHVLSIRCSRCHKPAPIELRGMYALMEWER